jgi:hypothetical protein
MKVSNKFVALAAAVCVLALVPVALAAGLTVKTTPAHPKLHQIVKMTVTGLKPGEKVKAVLTLPASGQKNTYYPKQKASSTGAFVNSVKAQVKGKNVWTYTGRTSHRKGSTSFVVR